MKTVFIFGAGASRQAGGPLMGDFLDRADELRRQQSNASIQEAIREFDDVFNAISELHGVFAKSYLDLDNIEALFGAIEMGVMLGKFADREEGDIKSLRNSLITLIYKTLENTIKFPVSKTHVEPPDPYNKFVQLLYDMKASRRHSEPLDVSFITFNYDLALDYALHCSLGYDYGLNQKEPRFPLLLKLHGSINWGVCKKCSEVIPYHFKDVSFNLLDDVYSVSMDLGSNLDRLSHCDNEILGPPLIVPPTWNKTECQGQILSVWRWAAKCLEAAENIFVIGYSLPETDSFFRYLFALGSESRTQIKRFWVFNPDSKGQVEKRFRELIGRGIESRFKFYRKTFQKAEPQITEALKSQQ